MQQSSERSTTSLISCALALLAALVLPMSAAHAQTAAASTLAVSPVGVWKTIDDETGQAKSLIRIVESNGVLSGKIEKLLTPGKENSKCDKCEGELKDQPVLGMEILKGLRKGDDVWEGGTILDPNNGKTYRSQLQVVDGGKKIEVRGYIGIPLLGRSQIWLREQ